MRQSRKEAKTERMARELLLPDRREAMTYPELDRTEFADEMGGGGPGLSRNGRRHSPGGRG